MNLTAPKKPSAKRITVTNRRAIMETAAAYLEADLRATKERISFTAPDAAISFLTMKMDDLHNEQFSLLFLNTRHCLIAFETLFHGTIDGASVYPRVVAKRALELNAAAIICCHNHPSGTPEPSMADQAITRRLNEALSLLDIRLLDHVVIGAGGQAVSMASRGMV